MKESRKLYDAMMASTTGEERAGGYINRDIVVYEDYIQLANSDDCEVILAWADMPIFVD